MFQSSYTLLYYYYSKEKKLLVVATQVFFVLHGILNWQYIICTIPRSERERRGIYTWDARKGRYKIACYQWLLYEKMVTSSVNLSKNGVFVENWFDINYRACFNIHNFFSYQATSNFGCDKLCVGLLSIFPHASLVKQSFTTSHTKSTKSWISPQIAMTPEHKLQGG